MNTDYSLYKSMSKKAGIADGKITDEFMFTVHAANLFLYDNNIGISDIQDGFVDGRSDGGIDFIFTYNDSMVLLQGKSTYKITNEEIINAINKIIRTIKAFKSGNYSIYNNKLKSSYLNAIDSISEDATIEIILCTNSEISTINKNKLNEEFKEQEYINYNCIIYDINEIEYKRLELKMENEYVKEDRITLSQPNNYLKYKDTGYVVNVRASSLKKLYQKHTSKGLFNYNLREHVYNKNVDNGIVKTIKKERENFWFYNNGITIACSECYIDGNICKLFNFSIINGAQTTTKIGESNIINSTNDFDLVCKIVIAKGGSLRENDSFISKISQASNSQKPIIPRDLKSNSMEQRLLQQSAADNKKPLAIQIKRGVKAPNINKVEKWQRVINEEVGQMILCCILQRPGTARSGKRKIFEIPSLYNQVFKRKMDFNTLYDLMKLAWYYDNFKVDYANKEHDVDLIASSRNGKFIILGIIIFLIKREKNIVIDCNDENLQKDNISGTIISKYREDDFEDILYETFEFFTSQLKDIYEVKKEQLKLTSYSNFFKTDKTYQKIILQEIEKRVCNDKWNSDRIKSYMKIFDI